MALPQLKMKISLLEKEEKFFYIFCFLFLPDYTRDIFFIPFYPIMKKHIVAPLVLLASLSTLTSCTKPLSETIVTPVNAPNVKVEVVTPAPTPAPVTPTPTPKDSTTTGSMDNKPVTATPTTRTRTEMLSYQSPA